MSHIPAPKKRKTDPNPQLAPSTSTAPLQPKPAASPVGVDSKIQQGKRFAVMQAQQEACLGCYRSFDSPFGNYLLPVIPTRADLFGEK